MNRKHFTFLVALVSAVTACPLVVRGADDTGFRQTVQPFLKQHCYACHGPEKQKARIRYDQMEGYRSQDQHLWTSVHEMLSHGEMPPQDAPQPREAEKKRVLAWIEREVVAAKEALGAGSTRRLNRRELAGALRDLTGLSVAYADGLPGDGKVNGFDTGAEGLQDAADSVTQLMHVTRRAVDGIRFLEPAPPLVLSADLRNSKDPRKAMDHWKDQGAYVKMRDPGEEGVGLLLQPKWVGERGGFEFNVPPPSDGTGVLRVKLTVSAYKPMEGIPNPHLWVEVAGKDIDYVEVTGTLDEPNELVYEVQIDDLPIESRGVEIQLSSRVEMPYGVEGFENEDKSKPDDPIPGGPGLFRPVYDRKKPPAEQPIPFVVLQRIEVVPDHVAAWPPADWRAEVGEITDSPDAAGRLLDVWMQCAWRRPVSDEQRQPFFALYTRLREQGMPFDNAVRATFQSVLLSGRFRYLASPADPDPVVAQHAIASRLSFMLWAAPPDDELRRLAAEGRLREPAVLDAQVDRLMKDPRSARFFEPFVTQWLEMGQPITLTMSDFQKQDFRFGRHLKASMHEETIQYIAELFRENRPAGELIDSDWTMMNNVLAWHYGYDGIEGSHLRKVTLRDDDPRGGGILGHGGIQSMLTWMGENWVIYRGAWALRHILNDPPPPPPLEVPELIPSDGENQGKTFRQLLKQHQENENCTVCHRKMDPMGFAFQNFDLSGRWRDVEYEKYKRYELDGKIEWHGEGETRPVDAAGNLPRGEEFKSFDEAKALIVEHYMGDVVGGILKNLMLYATGRQPDVQDKAEIQSIMKKLEPKGYPLRDLVKEVVKSQAFLDH